MKKWIEELLRKVLGEVLGAESLAKALMGVVEKVLAENPEWVKAIAEKGKEVLKSSGVEKLEGAEPANSSTSQPSNPPAGETPAPPVPVAGDVVGAPQLSWCYGGFDGSKAAIAEDAMLEGATLKGDTLTLKWDKGGCEQLGAKSAEDYEHTVACLFLADGKGGKFDWISTSRLTRGVGNIREKGYNGWPKSALDGGGRLWFCIAGVKSDRATSNGKRTALVEVVRA